jgi:hypothetical protein
MTDDSPERLELLVLRAMCQETAQGCTRAKAVKLLAGYAWREAIHQAMFECLSLIPTSQPDDLRRGLLACLTRKGFPDVDVETFFRPHGLSESGVEKLFRRLIESR